MNLYDSGCDVVRELIGKSEDISRFDFVLTLAIDEVSPKEINILYPGKPLHIYKSNLCHKLVLWTWSRKVENIIFDEGVDKLILKYAIEMSDKYSPTFPLVLGTTIRLKLAKLSVALAARLFSTDDGINILVKQCHVNFVKEWLERIYNKPSFGYEDYSLFMRASETKTESAREIIGKKITEYCIESEQFMINILNTKKITALEIQDYAQCSKSRSDSLRIELVSNNFLIKKTGFYVKSNLFIKFLKEELKK